MNAATAAAKPAAYRPANKIRFVTATSLFDGHDASVNIMRRVLQASGAEVIHLGHNRSVREIVNAALQEDVQGVAITSYQGGHVEFFKYMIDMLRGSGGENIKVFVPSATPTPQLPWSGRWLCASRRCESRAARFPGHWLRLCTMTESANLH